MNAKWLDDLFYFLNKDYGIEIVYTKIGKGVINYESGAREDVKTTYQIPSVLVPITLYEQYLDKISSLGKVDSVDRAKSVFLIKKTDMPDSFDVDDHIVYGQHRYTQLQADDLITLYAVRGVATRYAPLHRTLQVAASDNLGLADGI